MFKLSITGKHFLVYLSVCVLTMATVAVYSYYSAQKAIMKRTFEQLTSVRVEKSNNVERFFSDRIRDVEMVAASEAIHNMFDGKYEINNDGQYALKEVAFASYLNSYLKSSGYYKKVILIAGDGAVSYAELDIPGADVVFGSEPQKQTLSAVAGLVQHIRTSGKTCFQDYKVGQDGSPTIYVGTTVSNYIDASRKGMVILEISVKAINEMMFENNPDNGLGKTGEAYIVGGDYLIRTASRFQDHSIFKTKVESIGATKALSGTTGTEIIADYRGISVLSSFSKLNIPDLNWVMLAEMDTAEAMIPVYNLRNDILFLAIILFFLMLGVVYFISRKMTRPIIRLKQATSRITEGDYHQSIRVAAQDELGALTVAFNKMAAKLESQSEQIREARLKRLSSMLDGQEMERQRLSRDLHDSLGQSILAVKLKLEQARQSDAEKSRSSLYEALELIRAIIQEIRTISHDLMPPVLAAFGIEKGLNTLCKEASSGSAVHIGFEGGEVPDTLTDRDSIYLYRIAQEAVHNITKHAHATKATVSLGTKGRMLCLTITDNGCGFDYGDPRRRANGINNILERVELLGGMCTFVSEKEKGTTIDIKIPINL